MSVFSTSLQPRHSITESDLLSIVFSYPRCGWDELCTVSMLYLPWGRSLSKCRHHEARGPSACLKLQFRHHKSIENVHRILQFQIRHLDKLSSAAGNIVQSAWCNIIVGSSWFGASSEYTRDRKRFCTLANEGPWAVQAKIWGWADIRGISIAKERPGKLPTLGFIIWIVGAATIDFSLIQARLPIQSIESKGGSDTSPYTADIQNSKDANSKCMPKQLYH